MPHPDYYPAGAYTDPNAPYNQLDPDEFDGLGCPFCGTGVFVKDTIVEDKQRVTFYKCDFCGECLDTMGIEMLQKDWDLR